MRGRVFLAIIMLFLAISLCVLSFFVTKSIFEDVTNSVETTEQYILTNNTAKAKASADKLLENWEVQQKIFSLFIEHSSLERAELAIKSIDKYLSIEDLSASLIMCADAKICIEQIYSAEMPSFWNIF